MIGQAVGQEAGHEINEEVADGSVASVFNLAEVFQFVKDGFDQATATEERLLEIRPGDRFPISPERGDELDILLG